MATPLVESPDLAFEQMYERYARIVYRYALAVMRNPADAEDITQTTFLNAYRAMKGGEQPLKPRHWLLKIAHNACRMRWVRNSRRPQEVPLDDKAERIAAPESEKPNLRAVLDELAKLPFNQRSTIVMRELEGRSYEEIAEALDVSVSAVETLLVRARRSMRLRRSAINVLGAVQLPASLETFLESGAVVATGGALVGGVAFKAAALLVAGLVAGGAGYTAVGATKISRPDRLEAQAAVKRVERGVVRTPAAFGAPVQLVARKARLTPKQPPATAPKQQEPASAPVGIDAPPASAPKESPAGVSPPAPTPPSPAVPTPTAPPVSEPALPPVQPPALPVQPPPLPVQPPALSVQPPPLPVQPPSPPAVPTVTVPPVIPHLP